MNSKYVILCKFYFLKLKICLFNLHESMKWRIKTEVELET